MNVTRGLWRNTLGVELHVVDEATPSTGWPTLVGDIAIAERRDPLLGTKTYLVTETSLRECGYEPIKEEEGDE